MSRDVLLTLIAQGMNFAAMLFPALLNRLDLLAPLVTVSAIASITSYTATLSFASVHLGITTEGERQVSLRTSAIGNACGAGALALAAATVAPFSISGSKLLLASAVFALAQGFYIITTTVTLARGDHGAFARARMAYAVLNLGLTALVTTTVSWSLALAFAGPVTYFLSGLTVWRARPQSSVGRAEMGDYVRRYWPATLASLIGGLGAQANALATNFFGPFAAVWAGVVRISGGFSTIAQQVVAPVFDMRMSREVREGTAPERRRTSVSALGMGLALGVIATLGVVGTLVVGGVAGSPEFTKVLPIAIVYTIGVLIPTVGNKFLVVLGHQKLQMTWVVLKLISSGAALVVSRGFGLLASLAIIEVFFALAYVVLLLAVRGQVRAHRSSPGEGDDATERGTV